MVLSSLPLVSCQLGSLQYCDPSVVKFLQAPHLGKVLNIICDLVSNISCGGVSRLPGE